MGHELWGCRWRDGCPRLQETLFSELLQEGRAVRSKGWVLFRRDPQAMGSPEVGSGGDLKGQEGTRPREGGKKPGRWREEGWGAQRRAV